jgi:hypothetical protein
MSSPVPVDVIDQVLVPAPRPPDLDAGGAAVAELQRAGEVLHRALTMTVRAMRLDGATWTQVAQHLGVSRQAAEKRWAWVDDKPVALVRSGGRAEVRCTVTGLVWDPRAGSAVAAAQRVLNTTSIAAVTS